MYFVIKNNIDKKGYFVSGEFVEGVQKNSIEDALSLLKKSVIDFVRHECGKPAADNMKIIDIHSFDQVAEPIIDGMLLYRLDTNPNQIHVYKRVTTEVPAGYVFGKSVVSEFNKINIFELIECSKGITIKIMTTESQPDMYPQPSLDMVPSGPANIPIPRKMTQAPICDMLSALKQSPMFLKHKELSDL